MPLHPIERNELFVTGVEAVIEDDGFSFPSPPAVEARKIAGQLLLWCKDKANVEAMTTFVDGLFEMYKRCITCNRRISHSTHLERVWGSYHQERCSVTHRKNWCQFLELSLHYTNDCPIFYQYITDFIFKKAMKEEYFHIDSIADQQPSETQSLSYDEKNCLRYVAGSLFRAVKKKVARSALPIKEEMLLCMTELLEEEGAGLNDDESNDWIRLVDRGGLSHVSNTMFELLSAMEIVIKENVGNTLKDELREKLLSNHTVRLLWEALSANWGEEESHALLSMIVDHYITVRGFAFVSQWMDQYKFETKKKVQKSKGVRKVLLGSTSASTSTADHD